MNIIVCLFIIISIIIRSITVIIIIIIIVVVYAQSRKDGHRAGIGALFHENAGEDANFKAPNKIKRSE